MNIFPTFISDTQTAITVQPGECAFHHPAMLSQTNSFVDPAATQSMDNASISQSLAMPIAVVAFIPMQFFGPVSAFSIWARQLGNGIHHLQKHGDVTDIGSGVPDYERDSFSFDHNMALRARFSAIRWIRPGFFAPPGAGTLPESIEALDQSIWSARERRSKNARWSLSHTPACCQSRRRRQQVMPLPQPISGGSISHGMPVLSTNRIPVSTARLLRRGRPPLGLGRAGGRRGSTIFHKSSVISGFVMPQYYQYLGFC